MNIIAERVTGNVFVVAPDETRALEAFRDGNANVFDTEEEAIRDENGRNDVRPYADDLILNTYKIVVTAEKVH